MFSGYEAVWPWGRKAVEDGGLLAGRALGWLGRGPVRLRGSRERCSAVTLLGCQVLELGLGATQRPHSLMSPSALPPCSFILLQPHGPLNFVALHPLWHCVNLQHCEAARLADSGVVTPLGYWVVCPVSRYCTPASTQSYSRTTPQPNSHTEAQRGCETVRLCSCGACAVGACGCGSCGGLGCKALWVWAMRSCGITGL